LEMSHRLGAAGPYLTLLRRQVDSYTETLLPPRVALVLHLSDPGSSPKYAVLRRKRRRLL
jgi:hypothetical protein